MASAELRKNSTMVFSFFNYVPIFILILFILQRNVDLRPAGDFISLALVDGHFKCRLVILLAERIMLAEGSKS